MRNEDPVKPKDPGRPYRRLVARPLDRRTLLAGGAAAVLQVSASGCKEKGQPTEDTGEEWDVLGAEALEPISTNEEFYVVSYSPAPEIDREAWRLAFDTFERYRSLLDYGALSALGAREKEHTLQCIESRPEVPRMNNAVWAGVPIKEAMDAVGFEIGAATHLKFTCADGYTMGLPVTDLDSPLWLAWEMNGEDLPVSHGYPVRLLTPGRFGWCNPKHLLLVELLDAPYELPWLAMLEAYMEEMGFHPDSDADAMDLAVQNLVVFPTDLQFVADGLRVRILGKAFGGTDPISRVEVSTDGGESFEEAELTYAPGPDRWTLWRLVWKPPGPGTYALVTRCQTEGGQSTEADFPDNKIPWVGGMGLSVEVVA